MKSKKVAVILNGPPASGKGVQGEILAEKYKFKKYVTSDILRKYLPKKDKERMKRGELIESEKIFSSFSKSFKGQKKILLDGIFRKTSQFFWIIGFLSTKNYEIVVLDFRVKKSFLLDRIKKRNRVDDKTKIFEQRYKKYLDLDKEIKQDLKKYSIKINGEGTILKIEKDIYKKIRKFL